MNQPDIIKHEIKSHYKGSYRIEYDGKYVELYGLNSNHELMCYGSLEDTYYDETRLAFITECRRCNPEIIKIDSNYIYIRLNINGKK